MTNISMGNVPSHVKPARADSLACILRIGLGLVFVVGGWWKLSRAIDPAQAEALVAKYMASNGYINSFFEQYLFAADGAILTPLAFLIMLSAFELVSGLALLAGLFVRGLSFLYAFLLWSFVVALPVVTVSGVDPSLSSHFSPALLVQIRDIGLSGFFFVLLALGSGRYSVDQNFLGRGFSKGINWDHYGLLLRLSVAVVFIVGGFFAGYGHIKSFIPAPVILSLVGIGLASGYATRIFGAIAFAIIGWYCITKLNFDTSLWNNLNSIKRETAYLAGCGCLIWVQGGRGFRPLEGLRNPLSALSGQKP